MKSPAGLWFCFQCLCVISTLPPACPPPAHRVQPACRREDGFKHPPPLKIKSGLSHTHRKSGNVSHDARRIGGLNHVLLLKYDEI